MSRTRGRSLGQRARVAGALSIAFVLLLAGCGETTMPWSHGTPVISDAAISVSPPSLAFSARAGGATPAPQALHVTVKGTVYVGYQVSGAAVAGATLGQSSASDGADIVVSAAAPTSSATTWTGTVTVIGCVDRPCTRQVAGSPVVVPVTYSVTPPPLQAAPASLAFTVVQGGPAAAAQTLQLGGAGVAWTSSADQPWIKLGSTAGTAPATLAIGADATGLAPGAYSGTITIAGGVGVEGVRVAVQLTVQAPALRTDHELLSFQAVNGATVAAQTLSISLNSGLPVDWTATAGADWIVLDKGSGTTPDTLVVAIVPSRGLLASGSYSSSVTLKASYAGDTLTKVVPISLALTRPTLTVTPASLSAGGPIGREAPVTATLQVSLDTGANAYPWTANPDQRWIGLDVRAGKTGGAPTAVHVDWDRTGLTGGSYTGTIAVTAAVNGDILTARVPVSLNLDAHLLLADDDGVALATMPGQSALSRTLHVRDNLGLATPWTATADQAWLSVTKSGTTPGELVVTADPAGLSTDTIHSATVTLTSSDPTVERPETIRVGLWVGAAAAAASRYVAVQYNELALDPIRPLAYVHAGGSSITVYNIYTGAVVTTFSTASSALGRMTVASDGSRLFVAGATQPVVICVNLADLSQGTPFALPSNAEALAYTRTNGKRLLLAGNGHVLDASGGVDLGARVTGRYFANMIHVSQDGTRFAVQNAGISPSSFAVYGLDYTAVGDGELFITSRTSGSGGSNGEDLALNADGSRLYTVNGAPYEFPVFDVSRAVAHPPLLTSLPGVAYPGNIEVARDGRIFAGASASDRPVDTWIFSPTGTLLASMKLSVRRDVLVGQLKVSGDGLRLAALTEDPYLRFVNVAP